MTGNALRDMLNRLRWDRSAAGHGVTLVIRERREAGEAVRTLPFDAVVDIAPAGVTLADGTFIPYHRVLSVGRGDGVLWRVSRRDRGEA